jgi:hypothetical protein
MPSAGISGAIGGDRCRPGRIASTGAPHWAQNFAEDELRLPQLPHRSGNAVPHSEQNRAPSGLPLLQFAQRIRRCAPNRTDSPIRAPARLCARGCAGKLPFPPHAPENPTIIEA